MDKMMTEEQINHTFGKDAAKVAKIVCGQGDCFACYNCGHENKASYTIPQLGQNTVCPIAEYNVKPDTRTFAERLMAGENDMITEDEFFAVCACCKFSGGVTKKQTGGFILNTSDEIYMNYCADCPVNQMEETIAENIAESHC